VAPRAGSQVDENLNLVRKVMVASFVHNDFCPKHIRKSAVVVGSQIGADAFFTILAELKTSSGIISGVR
jgi:hypothetical protein